MIRGLVQMMFVGMVLALLLQGNLLVGVLILLAMTFSRVRFMPASFADVADQNLPGDGAGELLGLKRDGLRPRTCRGAQSRF